MNDKTLNGLMTANLIGVVLISIMTATKLEQVDQKIHGIQNDLVTLNESYENQKYQRLVERVRKQNQTGEFE